MRPLIAAFCFLALAAPAAPQTIDLHVIQESMTLTKADIADTKAVQQEGRWVVQLSFVESAALKFAQITGRNRRKHMQIAIDNRILMSPMIISAITGGTVVIDGNFTEAEAMALATKFK